jgi:hypothetical protein
MEDEEGIVARRTRRRRRTRRKEGEDGAVFSVLRVVRSFSVFPIALALVLVIVLCPYQCWPMTLRSSGKQRSTETSGLRFLGSQEIENENDDEEDFMISFGLRLEECLEVGGERGFERIGETFEFE